MNEQQEKQQNSKIKLQERRLIITCFTVGGIMLLSLLRHYL